MTTATTDEAPARPLPQRGSPYKIGRSTNTGVPKYSADTLPGIGRSTAYAGKTPAVKVLIPAGEQLPHDCRSCCWVWTPQGRWLKYLSDSCPAHMALSWKPWVTPPVGRACPRTKARPVPHRTARSAAITAREDVSDEEIVKLRAEGKTWEEISAAVGMSSSGCQWRWNRSHGLSWGSAGAA